MKKTSNRFWALLLSAVVLLSVGAGVYLYTRPAPVVGPVAVIYLNGEVYETIDLGAVEEGYTFTVTGANGLTNDVEVAPGKIRVCRADCPDQICVGQGWLDADFIPIACLPSTLVIQVMDGEDSGIDSMVG